MSEQPTPAVIIAKLAVLESKVDALHKRQDKVVERVDELSKVANIGKGALWAALKFGGVLLTEPLRVWRRPFCLSHAAMSDCSSMA